MGSDVHSAGNGLSPRCHRCHRSKPVHTCRLTSAAYLRSQCNLYARIRYPRSVNPCRPDTRNRVLDAARTGCIFGLSERISKGFPIAATSSNRSSFATLHLHNRPKLSTDGVLWCVYSTLLSLFRVFKTIGTYGKHERFSAFTFSGLFSALAAIERHATCLSRPPKSPLQAHRHQ